MAKPASIEEAKERLRLWMERNPLKLIEIDESEIACKKCGRVIYCGDLNKMCGDPECELKQRNKK